MSEYEVAWSTTVSNGAKRSLALLYVLGGAAYLLAAWFPLDPRSPTVLLSWFGALSLTAGVVLWLGRTPLPPLALHAVVALAAVMACVVVREASTLTCAVVTAFDLPCIAMLAAYFLPRRASRSQVAFMVALFTLAWFSRPEATPTIPWVVVLLTVIGTSEVLGNLMSQLQRTAVSDDLTGLLNRNGLRPSMEREIARSRRTGRPLALVVVDVDGLKQVNDILGHASGDRLLTDLASAWSGALRKEDLIARVGGDEFILLLPDTPVDAARDIVQRLREVDGPARGTRWSAGIAMLRENECADDLVDRADRRMYMAKRAGRAVEVGI